MERMRQSLPALARPLLVAVALGLMTWALAQEAQGPQLSRPSPMQVAHGHAIGAIREAR